MQPSVVFGGRGEDGSVEPGGKRIAGKNADEEQNQCSEHGPRTSSYETNGRIRTFAKRHGNSLGVDETRTGVYDDVIRTYRARNVKARQNVTKTDVRGTNRADRSESVFGVKRPRCCRVIIIGRNGRTKSKTAEQCNKFFCINNSHRVSKTKN